MAALKGLMIQKSVFFNTIKINLGFWWVVREALEFT